MVPGSDSIWVLGCAMCGVRACNALRGVSLQQLSSVSGVRDGKKFYVPNQLPGTRDGDWWWSRVLTRSGCRDMTHPSSTPAMIIVAVANRHYHQSRVSVMENFFMCPINSQALVMEIGGGPGSQLALGAEI